jgi:hypothetical protein
VSEIVRGTPGLGIGGHHSPNKGAKDEWLTPPHIIEALGPFDLDPCAPIVRPWPTAVAHYTTEDDGLMQPWSGRVWCNPPYGPETGKWLSRLADHRNGIALVFARTETAMVFEHAWSKAVAMLFLEGRLFFHHVDGSRAKHNSGAPSVLIAYDDGNAERLRTCGLHGAFTVCAVL